jgi:hypothetical protein
LRPNLESKPKNANELHSLHAEYFKTRDSETRSDVFASLLNISLKQEEEEKMLQTELGVLKLKERSNA